MLPRRRPSVPGAAPPGGAVLDKTMINVKDFGATGDGVADDTAAIQAAAAALAAPAGGVALYFPPGRYRLTAGISIKIPRDVSIVGEGMGTSVLVSAKSGIVIFYTLPAAHVTFADLGFEAADHALLTAIYVSGESHTGRVAIQRCGFLGIYGVTIDGAVGASVEDCVFQGLGRNVPTAIQAHNAARELVVAGNRFRYQNEGVLIGRNAASPAQEPTDNVRIVDNDFDGGWYTQVADFAGNATYTATGLTDQGTFFSNIAKSSYVRAMPVAAAGSATFVGTKLTDAGAHFQAAVRRGQIVRTGSAFAIVQNVESDQVLWVEEWLSDADRTPAPVPPAGDYTVFRVLVGQIKEAAGNSITLERPWVDLDGNVVTPADDTRYEASRQPGNYPILIGQSATRILIDRNHLRRGFSDQIGCYGNNCRITNNTIEDGQDMGVTLEWGNGNLVANNTILHQGTNCIVSIASADHVIVGNQCIAPMAISPSYDWGACIVIENSSRVLVANNHARFDTTPHARFAVLVNAGNKACNDNCVVANVADGFSGFEPLFIVRGAQAHGNQLLDNRGGDSKAQQNALNTIIRTA